MKFFKANFKPFVLTSVLFSATSVGYLSAIARRNFNAFQTRKENEVEFKDNTRPQNQYFGLSYGFRADQIVLDKLDSGDLLFIRFDCIECMSLSDICGCFYWQTTKPFPHFDSLGIIYRDFRNVYVLYDRFGSIVVEDYATFLQNPFWSEISARKIIGGARDVQKTLRSLFEDDAKRTSLTQQNYIYEIAANLNLLQDTGLKGSDIFIEDLDVEKFTDSSVFKRSLILGPRINIRTQKNKDLDYK